MSHDIPIGTYVRVSDGEPEPPLRFNKKHATWTGRNYDGIVVRHNKADDLIKYDSYDVQDAKFLAGWIIVVHSMLHPDMVKPVPGKPSYTVGPDTNRVVL